MLASTNQKRVKQMKTLHNKCISIALLASSLLMGCASTDPYTPQSDEDFVYDEDYSFAMNVIDGSLGFHNGLRDARRPKDADSTPGVGSYAANGIIGAAFGGGLGGGLLGLLGTNTGNEPLHSYYGVVYFPVAQKGNVQSVFDTIEQELIDAAESKREVFFVGKSKYSKSTVLNFKGKGCDIENEAWGFEKQDTCAFIHYLPPKLLKYASVNPRGEKGLYAVIGYEEFYTAAYLSFDIDAKYYTFSPVLRNRTLFPFVVNDKKIYPFVKPNKNKDADYLTIEQLINIEPWVKKHYYTAQ